jgi:16S rRNA G966 N2-methylase RsmD
VLRRAPRGTEHSLVLLDPPYDIDPDTVTKALEAASVVLAADGLIVLERASRREPDVPAAFRRVREVVSGDSTLTFLRRVEG